MKKRGKLRNILSATTIMSGNQVYRMEKTMNILPCILIAGIVLIPVGIGFLSTVNTTDKVTHVEDYSLCEDTQAGLACRNFTYKSGQTECTCYWDFRLTQDIVGDVTLYYEIDFDQANSTYANSRDNIQFSGTPSPVPAESCGDFSFDEGKPIFPCGEVADSIFNDTFSLLKQGDDKLPAIAVSYTGLVVGDATVSYHNPSEEVWANFSKPKSWPSKKNNKWDTGSNLTAAENEAFQVWMDTSLKRKPVFRVVDANLTNGLPAGNYSIRIDIYYPVDKYGGPKRFVLEGVFATTRTSHVVIGSIALIAGLVAIVFAAVLIIIAKRNEEKPPGYNDATLPVADRNHTTPHNTEDIGEDSKLNNDLR